MKWVRCLYDGDDLYQSGHIAKPTITTGKAYEVVEYLTEMGEEYIRIIQNNGNISLYGMTAGKDESGYDRIWFEDATADIRDNKLNQILDES
jgi:hypothetical protein